MGAVSLGKKVATSRRKKLLIDLPKLDWQAIWDIVEIPEAEDSEREPSRNSVTYGSIKRMILAGQLGPGRKMVHEDLAQALSVSRTPVREALERLYQEGFVTRIPRRGFYVAGITREEAFSLYGARGALEVYALQVTMDRGRISKGHLAILGGYAHRYKELIKAQVPTERILADVLFHLKLAELSGNAYVVRILAQTFERLALKRRSEGYRHDRSQRAATEHTKLLDALAHHDKRAAVQILKKHILSARDALLSRLYEPPNLPFDTI